MSPHQFELAWGHGCLVHAPAWVWALQAFSGGGGLGRPTLLWPKQMLMIFREAPVISGLSQPVCRPRPAQTPPHTPSYPHEQLPPMTTWPQWTVGVTGCPGQSHTTIQLVTLSHNQFIPLWLPGNVCSLSTQYTTVSSFEPLPKVVTTHPGEQGKLRLREAWPKVTRPFTCWAEWVTLLEPSLVPHCPGARISFQAPRWKC